MNSIRKITINQNGHTLLELIAVVVLLGILASVAIVGILGQQTLTFIRIFNSSDLLNDGRKAIDALRVDLHNLSTDEITIMDSDHLLFTDSEGNSVEYVLSDNSLYRNGVILVENVQDNPFTYLDEDQNTVTTAADIIFVGINLNLSQQNESIQLEEIIFARN